MARRRVSIRHEQPTPITPHTRHQGDRVKLQILLATHNPAPESYSSARFAPYTLRLSMAGRGWSSTTPPKTGPRVLASLSDQLFEVLLETTRLGPYRAFARLMMSGSTVPSCHCDQDDSWHPRKLERPLGIPGAAFSTMGMVDLTGCLIRERFLDR